MQNTLLHPSVKLLNKYYDTIRYKIIKKIELHYKIKE